MKLYKIQPTFGRLKIWKLSASGQVNLPPIKEIEKFTQKADVFIKTCEKEFPYKNNPNMTMEIETLKISAKSENLEF